MQPTLPVLILTLAFSLYGCGGGGDASTPSSPPASDTASNAARAALPTVILDENPSGAREDMTARNYFQAAPGDQWTYQLTFEGNNDIQTMTRTVSTADGSDITVTESAGGDSSDSHYRRVNSDLWMTDPLGSDTPAAAQAVAGSVIEYSGLFYPLGQTRRIVRQGSWGRDEDGDGIEESFRLEFTQRWDGQETLALPVGPALETVRFHNTVTLVLSPSRQANPVVTFVGIEDTWWASGIGLVKGRRQYSDGNGTPLYPTETFMLSSATVRGQSVSDMAGVSVGRDVALVHNALVYSRDHGRFYASVPGSVVSRGNRIAAIDLNGTVTYSAVIGSEPAAMGLAADGSALYVALNGSGEVVKLRLPDLVVAGRVRLPVSPFYGELYAENISVSPTDATVVAVSTWRAGVSPRHGGVVLLRDMVLQPAATQDHTGSNLIAFASNGLSVYGYNSETTEFGLRRIAVQANGLVEQTVAYAGMGFSVGNLDVSPVGIVLDNQLFRTTDLLPVGTINVGTGAGCRAYVVGTAVPNRLVCQHQRNSGAARRLAVADASTYVIRDTFAYFSASFSGNPVQLVPAADGAVALRFGGGFPWVAGEPAQGFSIVFSPVLYQ